MFNGFRSRRLCQTTWFSIGSSTSSDQYFKGFKPSFIKKIIQNVKEVSFFSNSFRIKFSFLVHCDIKMFLPQFFRLFGIIFCSKNHWTSRGHRCSQKWTGYFGLQSRGGSNADYNLVQRWGIGCNRSHRQISKFLDSFYHILYVRHYNPLLITHCSWILFLMSYAH